MGERFAPTQNLPTDPPNPPDRASAAAGAPFSHVCRDPLKSRKTNQKRLLLPALGHSNGPESRPEGHNGGCKTQPKKNTEERRRFLPWGSVYPTKVSPKSGAQLYIYIYIYVIQKYITYIYIYVYIRNNVGLRMKLSSGNVPTRNF